MRNQKEPKTTVVYNDGVEETYENMYMELDLDNTVLKLTDANTYRSVYIPLFNVRKIVR